MDDLRDKLMRERDLDISLLMPGTVERALDERRRETDAPDAEAYARLLDADREEYLAFLRALVRQPDRFFGDEDLTRLLRDHLLPQMLERKSEGDRVRVWVSNAGEGYLAYDIAMLLWKMLDGQTDRYDLKVLSTDPDSRCADEARFQDYPPDRFDDILREGWPVSETGGGLRIGPDVRRALVIGEHDPTISAPYPRVDLVVCRGLLPLLGDAERARLKTRLVFSLVLGGKLVLGRGERIGLDADEASPGRPFAVFAKQIAHPFELGSPEQTSHAARDAHKSLLERVQWPTIVVEPQGYIIHANWAASRELSGGEPIEGRNVADLWIGEPQTARIIETARESLGGAQPVEITKLDGWSGASAPLAGEAQGLAAVVLVRAEEAPPETDAGAATAGVARDVVQTVAEMWDYEEEARRLRVQAAAITESLYNQTQQLNRLRESLESRNAELQISNQELRAAIVQREKAEREVRAAYEREHRIAETLQKALLAPVPERIEGFELAARYVPAFEEAEVAGDFYHAGWLSDGRFFVALGDVAGKGLDAAVHAYMTKYMLLAYVNDTPEPEQLLARLNSGLASQGEDYRFVTMAYLLIETGTGVIRCASAGHEPAIICSPNGSVTTFDSTGTVMGVIPSLEYEPRTIDLEPGGSLLLYTDGLTDAGFGNRRLGTAGIAEVMGENCGKEPARLLDILYEKAASVGGSRLSDDATAIIVRRAG